jgi:hypothetical protein
MYFPLFSFEKSASVDRDPPPNVKKESPATAPRSTGDSTPPPPYISFLKGPFASICQTYSCSPFDVSKTRMQSGKYQTYYDAFFNNTLKRPVKSQNPVEAFRYALQTHGTFWNVAKKANPYAGALVNSGLKSVYYGLMFLGKEMGENQAETRSEAAVLKTVFATTGSTLGIIIPEAFKTGRQVTGESFRTYFNRNGFRIVTNGFAATLAREMPFNFALHVGVDLAADKFEKTPQFKQISEEKRRLLATEVVALPTAIATNPADRVKSLIQAGEARNTLKAIQKIALEEGMRGFFRGGLARMGVFALAFPVIDGAGRFYDHLTER